jgi:hypothetical protein
MPNFRKKLIGVIAAALLVVPSASVFAVTGDSTNYGDGNYGYCDYGSCALTLSSSGTVSVNATPSGTSCTVQSDSVGVTTDDPAGYTVQIASSTTATSLVSGTHTIAASSGTPASPVTLAANTWGYRVDSTSGFGSGPTSAQTNVSTPSLTFAGIPASNLTPNTLIDSSSPADPTVSTNVWYGLCANSSQASGTYSAQVTYTAVTN